MNRIRFISKKYYKGHLPFRPVCSTPGNVPEAALQSGQGHRQLPLSFRGFFLPFLRVYIYIYIYIEDGKRIINRTDHNTSDSLKAFMVAPFADMINDPGARRRLRLPSPTTALKSSTSPRRRVASSIFFFFILFYILFSCNTKKNQAECVRERNSFCPDLS